MKILKFTAIISVAALVLAGCKAPAPPSKPAVPHALVAPPAPMVKRDWFIPIQYPPGLFTRYALEGSADRSNWATLYTYPGVAWDTRLQTNVPIPHSGWVTVSNPPGIPVYFWRMRGEGPL